MAREAAEEARLSCCRRRSPVADVRRAPTAAQRISVQYPLAQSRRPVTISVGGSSTKGGRYSQGAPLRSQAIEAFYVFLGQPTDHSRFLPWYLNREAPALIGLLFLRPDESLNHGARPIPCSSPMRGCVPLICLSERSVPYCTILYHTPILAQNVQA
jgi:hypothetical protein